jgi:hypothetical protein
MFIDDLAKMQKLESFAGGNNKQRDHLNKLVDAINGMITSAQREAKKTPELMTITTVANGAAVDVIYRAYVPVHA